MFCLRSFSIMKFEDVIIYPHNNIGTLCFILFYFTISVSLSNILVI